MRFNVLVLLLLFFSVAGYGQKDLIITQAGEEIRCKIIEESPMKFSFAYINERGKVTRSEIFKTLISSFEYDYYPEDILPNEKLFKSVAKSARVKGRSSIPEEPAKTSPEIGQNAIINDQSISKADNIEQAISEDHPSILSSSTQQKEESEAGKKESVLLDNTIESDVIVPQMRKKKVRSEFKNYLKYRVGAKAGLANIINEVHDKSPTSLYKEKLLRGWVHGVDAAMFLSDYFGLGITYTNFLSSSSGDKIFWEGGNIIEPGVYDKINTQISHKYIGPTFLFRYPLDFKTFITATASPSYIYYGEKGKFQNAGFQSEYSNNGNTWGGYGTLGVDFLIGDDHFGRDIILSFECGYAHSKLNNLSFNNQPATKLDSPYILNRLEFSIALRFTRFPGFLR